jgi:ComF family protein
MAAIRSWAIYDGSIREAIQQLKYYRNVGLGNVFSRPLVEILRNQAWDINIIVPVPLGVARLKERGYNQASLLARPIAYQHESDYKPGILLRTRETKSQVELEYDERITNVAGAFEAKGHLVWNKNILVVDDVTTSGSTLDSCADALLEAGANKVYGLTLARARRPMRYTE